MITILAIYLAALVFLAAYDLLKIKTIPDFFLAKKEAGAAAVTGSLIATILGGSAVIGAVDAGPRLGYASSWFMLTGALGLLALVPLSEKVRKLGKYSLPDIIRALYGNGPFIAASVIIPIAWIGVAAAQIIAASKLLMTFTPLSYAASAVIVTLVFTGYTIAGGQRSVLKTDFLQAALILAGLILIAAYAAKAKLPPNGAIVPSFPFNHNFTPLDLLVLILTYATTYAVGPDIYSRLFCAKSCKAAKAALVASAALLVPVAFMIGYLSACGAAMTDANGALITDIAKNTLPPNLIPVVALSLLSVVLSSADTTLLSSSIILCGLMFKKTSLLKARLVILSSGIAALFIALIFTDIIATLLLALAVYAGAFIVPVLWGLFGGRSKPRYVTLAIILGGALALAGKLSPAASLAGVFISDILLIAAFLVNLLLLMAGRDKTNNVIM